MAASEGPESAEALLRPLGLSPDLDPAQALKQTVAAEAYYDLLERAAGPADDGLPLRYGASVRPEDYGAMGLALKTALTVREALERVARYIFVLSDTLEYGLREEGETASFHLLGRPALRRGSRLANEGALAALLSLLRQVATIDIDPVAVRFRHPAPPSTDKHHSYFRCPVRFDAESDAVDFDARTLAVATRLGDEGLSAFLLAQLEELRDQQAERTLASQVQDAVTDALCDGVPSRDRIARRLGMSERTLHRRLADEGLSYRELANEARRRVAEALLAIPDHSLAEVAFLTGFSDQSAFSRAFKRWSGQTPGAFREGAAGG